MKILIYVGAGIVVLALTIGLIGFLSTSEERNKQKLFHAIRNGDPDSVTSLLAKKGITVNTEDINGLTPLAVAASQGNIEMAKLLIRHNADVNSTAGRRDFPVLMYAVTGGQDGMVRFLIDQGADVNAVADASNDLRYKNGVTALMMATAKGNGRIAELLIDGGADVNAKGAWDITTGRGANLQDALSAAFTAVTKIVQSDEHLVGRGTKENAAEAFFKPPLVLAIVSGKPEIVKLLLERGADSNWVFEPKNPGDFAAPLLPGMNALMYAAYKGEVEAMELLAARGLEVNSRDNRGISALWYAIYGGSAESVKFLVKAGAATVEGKNGATALIQAAMMGQDEIIKALVELGSDVNRPTNSGITALMWAASNGHVETAKLLMNLGAAINAKTTVGWTALMTGARGGSLEIVKLLVERGADINARSENGRSALWYGGRFPEIVRFLSDQGAEVVNP